MNTEADEMVTHTEGWQRQLDGQRLSRPPLRPPTVELLASGRFSLKEKLGEGASGRVYRVHDNLRNKEVALKVLHRSSGHSLARFKREFRSLADVQHPNLVHLHELISDGDLWCFSMDLVDGEDLDSYLMTSPRLEELTTLDSPPNIDHHPSEYPAL